MKLVDIDYYAIYGNSWLNKISAETKLSVLFVILSLVIILYDYRIIGFLYFILFSVILFSHLPKLRILFLSLYPLIFIFIFILSVRNISYSLMWLFVFKAITASTAFLIIIFTTSFVEIFKTTERFLPSFLVNILFLTYRSIFILWTTLENLQLAMHIRSKFRIIKPVYSIKILGNALGFLIISAIESSENMFDIMRLRGYSGNLEYLRK